MKQNVFMNPIRQRILQYLLLHEKGTVKEIYAALEDVPMATLYRHINMLLKHKYLEIIQEIPKRGAVEKTFVLAVNPMGTTVDNESISYLIDSSLLFIMKSFQTYFAQEDRNPQEDMIALTTSALFLSQEEFMELSQKIGVIMSEYLEQKPKAGRQLRNITFISSPNKDEPKPKE